MTQGRDRLVSEDQQEVQFRERQRLLPPVALANEAGAESEAAGDQRGGDLASALAAAPGTLPAGGEQVHKHCS